MTPVTTAATLKFRSLAQVPDVEEQEQHSDPKQGLQLADTRSGSAEQPPPMQQQEEEERSGPNFISAARDAAAHIMSVPLFRGPDDDSKAADQSKSSERSPQHKKTASRNRRMQTTGEADKNSSQHETDDCGKMVYRARSSSAHEPMENEEEKLASGHEKIDNAAEEQRKKGQEWDTDTELDVDAMLRKEVAWLKADGYLAGQASFFEARFPT